MFIEKISKQEAINWIKTVPSAFSIATIFGGDRWSCVDSVFSAKKDNKIVGIITISNEGENYNNQPSIVGLGNRSIHNVIFCGKYFGFVWRNLKMVL